MTLTRWNSIKRHEKVLVLVFETSPKISFRRLKKTAWVLYRQILKQLPAKLHKACNNFTSHKTPTTAIITKAFCGIINTWAELHHNHISIICHLIVNISYNYFIAHRTTYIQIHYIWYKFSLKIRRRHIWDGYNMNCRCWHDDDVHINNNKNNNNNSKRAATAHYYFYI